MKKHSLLACLVILAAACGGGDKKADRKALTPPPPPDPTANGEDPNGEMPEGDDADPVKFLVKREDGLLYAVKSVSDFPYSGKIEEMSQTDGSLSVKNYQDGVLKSIDEYFSGTEQKKSSTTFDALGQVQNKEEWREDGTHVVAASKLPQVNSNILGRRLKWEEAGLKIYEGKPVSTVLKVFGAPNDRKVRLTATTRTETWIYNNIKVLEPATDEVKMRTVIFSIEKNGVTTVEINQGGF